MRVLAIGDTHAPYHYPGALDFLADIRRQHRPQVVIHIGDLGDQHGWSRHERLPDSPGQAEEDRLTLGFCRELYKLFPRALACIGNHDVRVAKRCITAGLPSRFHISIPALYESPSTWQWAEAHRVGDVVFQHGDGYGGVFPAMKAAKDNRLSTVIGHIHSAAGVQWSASAWSRIFGANTGCLIDPTSFGMAYARKHAAKPVLGSLIVDGGIPHFIPMEE